MHIYTCLSVSFLPSPPPPLSPPFSSSSSPPFLLLLLLLLLKAGGSLDRLKSNEKVIHQKIKAWEDREKTKADNKAERKIASTDVWQNTKKAALEAEVKKIEADVEKLRLKEMEKIKNKEAQTVMAVESKKAAIEAKRELDKQKAEEKAAKHRSTNTIPTKCFGICQD